MKKCLAHTVLIGANLVQPIKLKKFWIFLNVPSHLAKQVSWISNCSPFSPLPITITHPSCLLSHQQTASRALRRKMGRFESWSFSTQAPPLIASTNAGEPGARIAARDLSSSLERLRMLSSVSTGFTSNSLSLPLLRGESYIFFSHQMCISFVSAPHLSRNPSACQMMYRKSWFIVGWFGRHRVAAIGLNLGGHNLR